MRQTGRYRKRAGGRFLQNRHVVGSLPRATAREFSRYYRGDPHFGARRFRCAIEALLRRRLGRFIRFGHGVPVPIRNGYATPDTLGADRLAAAVGAATLYPGNNVLIVDFGTAITFDFVSAEGEFLGGNISPGAATRFRALHHFTRKLPLCELIDREVFMGRDTVSAIEGGVVNGIVYEVEGYIRDLERKYDGLRIIFTGGDSNFFAKRVKKPDICNL